MSHAYEHAYANDRILTDFIAPNALSRRTVLRKRVKETRRYCSNDFKSARQRFIAFSVLSRSCRFISQLGFFLAEKALLISNVYIGVTKDLKADEHELHKLWQTGVS